VTFQILGTDGQPMDGKAITTGRLRLDFAWSTADIHNVADVVGDKYRRAGRGARHRPDANMASVADNGNGTYSYTLAQGAACRLRRLDSRQGADGSCSRATRDARWLRGYPESAFAFGGGVPREQLVDPPKLAKPATSAWPCMAAVAGRPDYLYRLP